MTLQPYRNFAPTQFDCKGLTLYDQQDWLVVPVTQNRDSEALERSNFRIATKMLSESKDNPDEDSCYENHSFNHWACGWFEILIVKPGSDCERIANEIADCIESYPILDERDFSELENEEWDKQENDAVELLSRNYDLKFDEYYDDSEGKHWYMTKIIMEDSGEIVNYAKREGLEVEVDDDNLMYVRLDRER